MPDPTAMTPEDVPDELIQAFTAAEDIMYDAGESISEESLRIGLAAVLPAHEAMVLARVKDLAVEVLASHALTVAPTLSWFFGDYLPRKVARGEL